MGAKPATAHKPLSDRGRDGRAASQIFQDDGFHGDHAPKSAGKKKPALCVCACARGREPQRDGASPSVGQDGNPPAFDEAQVAVGELHLEGQLGHPDGQLQRRAQVLVAEDHPGAHGPPRLLPVDEHVVAVHGHLERIGGGSEVRGHLYVNGHAGGKGSKRRVRIYGADADAADSSQSVSRLTFSAEQICSKDL